MHRTHELDSFFLFWVGQTLPRRVLLVRETRSGRVPLTTLHKTFSSTRARKIRRKRTSDQGPLLTLDGKYLILNTAKSKTAFSCSIICYHLRELDNWAIASAFYAAEFDEYK